MKTFSLFYLIVLILSCQTGLAAEDPLKFFLDQARTILREDRACPLFDELKEGGLPATRETKSSESLDSNRQAANARHDVFFGQLGKFSESAQALLNEVKSLFNDEETQKAFQQQLFGLAFQYDSERNPKARIAIVDQMIRMFSIRFEDHYINLIASGPFSKELKWALYFKLTDIFANDPSWQRPLETAMSTGGVL